MARSVSDKHAGARNRGGSATTADRAAAEIRGISFNSTELKQRIRLSLTFFDR
jgi:hypothetical protein